MDSIARVLAASAFSLPCMTTTAGVAEYQPNQWRRFVVADPSPVSLARGSYWFGGLSADPAAMPGHILSSAVLRRMGERQELIGAIEKLRTYPFSRSAREGRTVSAVAAEAARAFVAALPDQTPTPRVSPDGEGGLMFRWGNGIGGAIVIVDGLNIHAVANPATPQARYVDDIPFVVLGPGLPLEVLEVLPSA